MQTKHATAARVSVNGKTAKASLDVKPGDIIEIRFGEKLFKAEILNVAEHVLKNQAAEMYKVIV